MGEMKTNFWSKLPREKWEGAVRRLLDYHRLSYLITEKMLDSYYEANYSPDMVSRDIRERIGMVQPREVM